MDNIKNLTEVEGVEAIHNLSPVEFSLDVETLVKDKKIAYIDAIITVCNEQQIEEVIVPTLLTQELRLKLSEECEKLHLIEPMGRIKF